MVSSKIVSCLSPEDIRIALSFSVTLLSDSYMLSRLRIVQEQLILLFAD